MLVQEFHPDINPDPSAAEKIREINEAYEVLGDAQNKIEYDNKLLNPYPQQQPTAAASVHRDPRYRRSQRPIKRENRQLELVKEYVHLAVKASWAGCILCFFLLIDYCYPRHVVSDVAHGLYSETLGRTQTHYLSCESGRLIKIRYEDKETLERNKPVEIIETGITSIALEVYFPEKDYHIRSLATIYRNYAFVPVLLLICSVLCLVVKDKVEFRFNLGIVSFFLLIFTIILILK